MSRLSARILFPAFFLVTITLPVRGVMAGEAAPAGENVPVQPESSGLQNAAVTESSGEKSTEPGKKSVKGQAQVISLSEISKSECLDLHEKILHRAIFGLDYRQTKDLPLGQLQNLDRSQMLSKTTEAGRFELLLGTKIYPSTASEFILWGRTLKDGQETGPNPELERLKAMAGEHIDSLLGKKEETYPLRELRTEIFQLSHVQPEQCLKILTMLGYNTKSAGPEATMDQLPLVLESPNAALPTVVADNNKLASPTSSAPQNRLFILYHPTQAKKVNHLHDLLDEKIDVAARQVLIEALVVELTEEGTRELGVQWEWEERVGEVGGAFETIDSTTPLKLFFSDYGGKATNILKTKLRALVRDRKAQILASPSILTLDNSQALIRVGREEPIRKTVYTGEYSGAVEMDIDYKEVGITLNIKPRISSAGRHVSMQIQTEVSEVMDYITANNVEVAPIVNTRKAQTSAQVENNTAFIIGGLIRNEKDHTVDRIPFISRIPLIGKLFQVSSTTNKKREDIIVLTPRVLEPKGPKRALLPKGSDQFNFTDCRLFRESYRLKTDDVFDLEFIKDNETLKHVFRRSDNFLRHYPSYRNKPPFDVVGGDRMPGEEAVVVRMLYEIAKTLDIPERVKLRNLIYFEKDPGKPAGYDVVFLGHKLDEIRGNKFQKKKEYPRKVLVLRYDLEPGAVLGQITHTPAAEVQVREVQSRDEMENLWYELNRLQPPSSENKDGVVCHRGQTGIVLDSMEDVERLRAAIVVREMISVNKMQSLLSINNFKVGRKIQLPQINPDGDRIFLVDHNVSRYHYYTDFYYAAFQNKLRNYYERMREIFKEKDF